MQSEIRRPISKLNGDDRLAIVKKFDVKVPVQHVSTDNDLFRCVSDKTVRDIVYAYAYEYSIIVSINFYFI